MTWFFFNIKLQQKTLIEFDSTLPNIMTEGHFNKLNESMGRKKKLYAKTFTKI